MRYLRRTAAVLVLSLVLSCAAGCQVRMPVVDESGQHPDTSQPILPDDSSATASVLPSPESSEPVPGPTIPVDPVPEPEAPAEPAPEPEVPAEPAPEPEVPAEPVPEEPAEQNTTIYVLMYHHVVPDGEYCNDWTITTGRLREDLQWLKDNGYTCVLPRELVEDNSLPDKAAMITFDDGYASNYHLAFPLLQEFELKAVISPITAKIDDGLADYLSWDMCREMSQSGLVEIGSHTHNLHSEAVKGILRLEGESREEYEARVFPDLLAGKERIETNLGTKVHFFAYPYGVRDSWGKAFVEEHFAVTVTTRHGPASIRNNLYDLSRHNITVRDPASKYLP